MIGFLFQLLNLIISTSADNANTPAVAEDPTASGTIGFIVLGIIVGPVLLLTIASILGAPRTFRVPGLFIGSLILLVGAIMLGFAMSGVILKFIIPQ